MDSEVTDEVGVESIRPSPEVIECVFITVGVPISQISTIRTVSCYLRVANGADGLTR